MCKQSFEHFVLQKLCEFYKKNNMEFVCKFALFLSLCRYNYIYILAKRESDGIKLNLETFNIILFRDIQRHTPWDIILDYKREKHIFETLHFSILKHTSTLQTQHSKLQQPSTTVIKLLGYIFFYFFLIYKSNFIKLKRPITTFWVT